MQDKLIVRFYVAENLVPLESSWTGNAEWLGCASSGETNIKLFVTSVKHSPYFASRIRVKVTAVIELFFSQTGRNVLTAEGTGYYLLGQRELKVQPTGLHIPQVEDLYLTYHFDDSDHSRCEGHLIKAVTGVRCAAVTLYHN